MFQDPSGCCSHQSLRVYDRAPANFRSQQVQAFFDNIYDISRDQNIICGEIGICSPCLENVTMCPVPGRPGFRRLTACITAPVTIEYGSGRGRCTAEGIVQLPVDLLIRVPEVAPYDLRVLIDTAIVHSGEYCGNNMFTLCVTVCAAVFVVVDSPCCEPRQPCRPSCPVCPPICQPSCGKGIPSLGPPEKSRGRPCCDPCERPPARPPRPCGPCERPRPGQGGRCTPPCPPVCNPPRHDRGCGCGCGCMTGHCAPQCLPLFPPDHNAPNKRDC